MPDIKKPLMYTQRARHRILAALNWDERAKKTTIVDKVLRTDAQHDLDISCFIYDVNKEYIDFVGPMAQDSIDHTESIYHSGDDATGSGDTDDESISCELIGLPDDTAHLIFVTEIRSGQTFSEIGAPHFRLADGINNQNLFELDMSAPEGRDRAACVMARVFRDKSSPTGWSLHAIADYPDLEEISDWGSHLTRYL